MSSQAVLTLLPQCLARSESLAKPTPSGALLDLLTGRGGVSGVWPVGRPCPWMCGPGCGPCVLAFRAVRSWTYLRDAAVCGGCGLWAARVRGCVGRGVGPCDGVPSGAQETYYGTARPRTASNKHRGFHTPVRGNCGVTIKLPTSKR